MTISPKLKKLLESKAVEYEILQHSQAFTAQEIAGAQHVPGKMMVKSVIVKFDGQNVMCVLPAVHMLDFDKFKVVTGAGDAALATEEEIAQLFPDYEIGAEPPFGNLYEMDVYVDKTLKEDADIYFNGGTHTDIVKMKYEDYEKLVQPKAVADLGRHV